MENKYQVVNQAGSRDMVKDSSILTSKQQNELNKAIVQYVRNILEPQASEIPDVLCKILDVEEDGPTEIIPNYLEKKWTTVSFLQKRINELEERLQLLSNLPRGGASLSLADDNWIPQTPCTSIKLQQNQIVNCVSTHPELPILVAGCSDGTLITWNILDGAVGPPSKIIKAHTRGITSISWSKAAVNISSMSSKGDSKNFIVATSSVDSTIKVWNGADFSQIRNLIGHDSNVSSLVFSPSEARILYSCSRDKSVKIWDVVKGFSIDSFVGHSDWVRNIDTICENSQSIMNDTQGVVTENRDYLLSCSNDQSVRLSDAKSGKGIALLLGHTHVIESCKFMPKESYPYLDKFLKSNAVLNTDIPESVIKNVDHLYETGPRYCISGGRDKKIYIWLFPPLTKDNMGNPLPSNLNGSRGWILAELTEHDSWVRDLVIHPNGRFVFSSSDDKSVKIWDLDVLGTERNIKASYTLNEHDAFVNSIHFSRPLLENKKITSDTTPNNEYQVTRVIRHIFISASTDQTIKLWH